MTFRARGLYASSSKEPGRFRKGPWMLLGGVLVVALVVVTAFSVLGNVVVHQTDRDDSYDGAGVLRLSNETGGQVTLSSGQGDEIDVQRRLRGGPLSEPEEEVNESGDELRIDGECSGLSFFSTCSIDYEITVPEGTEVQVETVSGDINAGNLDGELTLSTVSGDIDLSEQTGDASAETVSGQIKVTGMDGSLVAETTSGAITAAGEGTVLDASTTSGEIDLSGFTAEEVRAETTSGELSIGGGFTTLEAGSVSGGIEIDTDTPFELMSLETVSGSVRATVPDEAYDITGESVSGDRTFDVDTASNSDSRIDVNTVSGEVRISS